MKANLTTHEWISHPSCAHVCEPLQAATVKGQFIRRSTTVVENGRRRKRKKLSADAIAAAALAETMPIIGTSSALCVDTSASIPQPSDSAMESDAWMTMTAEAVDVKEEPPSYGTFSFMRPPLAPCPGVSGTGHQNSPNSGLCLISLIFPKSAAVLGLFSAIFWTGFLKQFASRSIFITCN